MHSAEGKMKARILLISLILVVSLIASAALSQANPPQQTAKELNSERCVFQVL
jgi:hypothetical protein